MASKMSILGVGSEFCVECIIQSVNFQNTPECIEQITNCLQVAFEFGRDTLSERDRNKIRSVRFVKADARLESKTWFLDLEFSYGDMAIEFSHLGLYHRFLKAFAEEAAEKGSLLHNLDMVWKIIVDPRLGENKRVLKEVGGRQ